jgi:indolepyruvate ferredoxin oxidoreductase
VRIATGEADAVIGGDIIVAASRDALSRMTSQRTRAVVNACETPTAEFTRDPDWQFPLAKMQDAIRSATSADAATFIDATTLSTRLLGDAIGTNLFLLGHAWQQGLVPVSGAALERAIELNGTAVEMNLKAFLWGRRAAHERAAVERYALPAAAPQATPKTLDQLVADRAADLAAYQDEAYAQRYRAQVNKWRTPTGIPSGHAMPDFAEMVARNYYKLLAIKDEYEVARLYNDPAFQNKIGELFEGDYEIRYHLAPPLLSPVDPNSGRPKKCAFGPWMGTAFRWLAKFKGLRGTALDVFARSEERRIERQLIADYEADLELALARGGPENADALRALLSWPEQVRGFGVVKVKSIDAVREQREAARRELSR